MKWYPRACPACTGDLHDDLQDRGWLTCMMCARSFRAIEILNRRRVPPADGPTELSRVA